MKSGFALFIYIICAFVLFPACSNPPSFVPLFNGGPAVPNAHMVVMPDSTLRLRISVSDDRFTYQNWHNITDARITIEGVEYPFSRIPGRIEPWLEANIQGALNTEYFLKVKIADYPDISGTTMLKRLSTLSVKKYHSETGIRTYELSGGNLTSFQTAFCSITITLKNNASNSWYLIMLCRAVTYQTWPTPLLIHTGLREANANMNVNLPPNHAFQSRHESQLSKDFPYRLYAFSYKDYINIGGDLSINWIYDPESPFDILAVYEIPEPYFRYLETANLQANVQQLPFSEPVLIEGNLENADGVIGAAIPILIYPLTAAAALHPQITF